MAVRRAVVAGGEGGEGEPTPGRRGLRRGLGSGESGGVEGGEGEPTPGRRGLRRGLGSGESGGVEGVLEVWEVSRLRAHPLNWRVHGLEQRSALDAVMARVGVAGVPVVNRVTERILDGHLRVKRAAERGETQMQVFVVELDERRERLVLASYDLLGSWAQGDVEAFGSLRSEVSALLEGMGLEDGVGERVGEGDGAVLEAMLREVDGANVKAAHERAVCAGGGGGVRGWWVSVDCRDEQEQETVYGLMRSRDREVRVLSV